MVTTLKKIAIDYSQKKREKFKCFAAKNINQSQKIVVLAMRN